MQDLRWSCGRWQVHLLRIEIGMTLTGEYARAAGGDASFIRLETQLIVMEVGRGKIGP
jgi:hypothetical protein